MCAPKNSGNPINLMTGNKFQKEVDFLPGTSLTFNRLYNSANADSGIRLGQCWHYSYAVSLSDSGQLDQLVAYSENFLQTVYHTNDTDLAAYFT